MHHRHQGKDNRPDVANVRPMHSGICPLCLNSLALQATAPASQPEFQGAKTSNKALQTEPTYFSLSGDASFASRLVKFSVRPHLRQHRPETPATTPPDHTIALHFSAASPHRSSAQAAGWISPQIVQNSSRTEQFPHRTVPAQCCHLTEQSAPGLGHKIQGPSLTGVKSRMQNQFS